MLGTQRVPSLTQISSNFLAPSQAVKKAVTLRSRRCRRNLSSLVSTGLKQGDNHLLVATLRTCSRFTRGNNRIVCQARGSRDGQRSPEQINSDARIRSEVIAPFRSVRIVLYLAFMVSASLGGLIALTRVIGALGGAPNADPLSDSLKDLGIDLAAIVTFALLYRSDKKAERKSIARITREENLSRLKIELSNKRVVSLGQLRGTCRLIIIAGTEAHIEETFRQADQYKEALVERGVLMVPFFTDGKQPASSEVFSLPSRVGREESQGEAGEGGGSGTGSVMTVPELDKRFVAAPIYTNEWQKWLQEQMELANVQESKPVYISLRIDGRVRASGVGFPPLRVISLQLPPLRGMWAGALDGLDGRV